MIREMEYRTLGRRVLVTAAINYNGPATKLLFDWAAYIDAVPGESHNNEYEEVARTGNKISKDLAQVLFPHLPIHKYRR